MNTNEQVTAEGLINEMPRLLERLNTASRVRVAEVVPGNAQSGVYALFEGNTCVYVGRTRNHARRLKQHSGSASRENQAALAFSLTREALNLPPADYSSGNSRKSLMRRNDVKATFQEQKRRIAAMEVSFVEVEDGPKQAMFEIYAAIALRASHSKFLTH